MLLKCINHSKQAAVLFVCFTT